MTATFFQDAEGNQVELLGEKHDVFTVRRHNGQTEDLSREAFKSSFRPVPEDTATPKTDEELQAEAEALAGKPPGKVHNLEVKG